MTRPSETGASGLWRVLAQDLDPVETGESGDLNADGKPDLVSANQNGDHLQESQML